jgi:hypothetical protein
VLDHGAFPPSQIRAHVQDRTFGLDEIANLQVEDSTEED